MNRREIHDRGVRYVTQALRRRGAHVETHKGNDPITLSVNGLTVAVRVAQSRVAPHHVTVGGRSYHYSYPTIHWNLHVHGARGCQPDVWVLVVVGAPVRVFIVPAEVIGSSAKTAQLLDTERARQRKGAKLRAYEGHWAVIIGRQAKEQAA